MIRYLAAQPRKFITAIALTAIATGCASANGESDTGIPPQDPALVTVGSDLYAAGCAPCHGQDLRGTDRGPSHLSTVYQPSHHADGSFLLAVKRGSPAHHWQFGDMPPIEGLTEEAVAAIVAFVRENQRLEGFEPYPP